MTEKLEIGQRIYWHLYGGKRGIITAVNGSPQPESVRILGGGAVVSGGQARIDVVWEDGTESRQIPEAIVMGAQWDVLDDVADMSEIMEAMAHAQVTKVERQREKQAEEERKEAERVALPAEYPFLIPLAETPTKSSHAAGAANLKRHLAREFPRVKFGVKSDSFSNGDRIRAEWTDGPTTKEIDAIANLYQEGSFDGMQDLYTYDHAAFPDVFGGAKYVTTNRHLTDARFQDMAVEMYPDDPPTWNHNRGDYDGVDLEQSHVIKQAVWGRSYYAEAEPEPAKPQASSGVTIGEYKGHPTITLETGGRPFTFGLTKARAIVENFNAIREFAHTAGCGGGATSRRRYMRPCATVRQML